MKSLGSMTSIALLTMALVFATAPDASADPRGVFVVRCAYSHSLPDDPILHPGEPGASHLHDFFGNTTTNAMSTIGEMRHGTTTCVFARDTAGYWFPAAYLGDTPVVPTFSKTYYFGVAGSVVEPIPRGLQLVGGDAAATSGAQNVHVSWHCGAKGTDRTPKADHPYDCTRYANRWSFVDGLVGRVEFPSCWDGIGLGPTDLAYPVRGACPAGYGHRLPLVRMQVHFGILDPCAGAAPCRPGGAGDNVTLRLASGPYYTLHADFWNTWRQVSLERLIERCLNEHVLCGNVRTGPGSRT